MSRILLRSCLLLVATTVLSGCQNYAISVRPVPDAPQLAALGMGSPVTVYVPDGVDQDLEVPEPVQYGGEAPSDVMVVAIRVLSTRSPSIPKLIGELRGIARRNGCNGLVIPEGIVKYDGGYQLVFVGIRVPG